MRAWDSQEFIECLYLLQKMAGLLGSGLEPSCGPKLLVLAALGNDLIDVMGGIRPAMTALWQSKNVAQPFFGVLEIASLQVGHGFLPERLLLPRGVFGGIEQRRRGFENGAAGSSGHCDVCSRSGWRAWLGWRKCLHRRNGRRRRRLWGGVGQGGCRWRWCGHIDVLRRIRMNGQG